MQSSTVGNFTEVQIQQPNLFKFNANPTVAMIPTKNAPKKFKKKKGFKFSCDGSPK